MLVDICTMHMQSIIFIYNDILYYNIKQLLTLYINPGSNFNIIKIVHFNKGYSM